MTKSERRPPVWVGHIVLHVPDIDASKAFFVKLGMRDVGPEANIGILELRGGTHLLLLPSDQPVAEDVHAPFDLMVDHIETTHASYLEMEMDPSPLRSKEFHRFFLIREPGGHQITVNSTHVSNQPV